MPVRLAVLLRLVRVFAANRSLAAAAGTVPTSPSSRPSFTRCFEPDSVDDPDYSLMRDKLGMSWLLDCETDGSESKPAEAPGLGSMDSDMIERALTALGMNAEECGCDDGTASLRFVSKRKNKVQKRQLERQMENEAASAPQPRREVRERNRAPAAPTTSQPVFASRSRPGKQGARAAMATAHQRTAAPTAAPRGRAQKPALADDDEFFDAYDETYMFDEDEDEEYSPPKQRASALLSRKGVPHYIPGYGYQEPGGRQQRQKQQPEDKSRAGWDDYQGDGGSTWGDFQGDAPGWDFGGQGDAPGWDANGPGADPAEAYHEPPDVAEVDEALNLGRIMAESEESAKLEAERMNRRQAREEEALRQVLLASQREEAGNSPDDEALRMALLASQTVPSSGKSREEQEEEEALRWALEQSQNEPVLPPPPADDDEEEALRWALEQSQSDAVRPPRPIDEDEEEALRQALAESQSLAANQHDVRDRDDALRHALAESARQAPPGLGMRGGGGGDGSFGQSYAGAAEDTTGLIFNPDLYTEDQEEPDNYVDAADVEGQRELRTEWRAESDGMEETYDEATEVLLRMGFEPERIRRVLVSAHGDLAYSMETLLAGLDDDEEEDGNGHYGGMGLAAAEERAVYAHGGMGRGAAVEEPDDEELIFNGMDNSFDEWFQARLQVLGCGDPAYFSYLRSYLTEMEAKDSEEGRDPRTDDGAVYERVSDFTDLIVEVLHDQLGSALKLQVFSSEVVRRFYNRDE